MTSKKSKKKYLNLKANIPLTDEKFTISFITPNTSIKELKRYIELASGIPVELQIIHYLDEADLNEESDVKRNDIVNGAVLTLHVWHAWLALVESSSLNDADWLFSLGITKDTSYTTPNSQYMTPKQRQQWIQNRADIALIIASHRGHTDLCELLLQAGANVNATTLSGRTPLHFAASQDHGSTINLLLNSGADINICDVDGNNALAIANMFGHKGCERYLFLFRWQSRAKATKPQYLNPPMMAFQKCDSLYPKWKSGPASQVYLEKLLPPQEFIGSSFDAPKRRWHRKSSAPPHLRPLETEGKERSSSASKTRCVSFDDWINKKKEEQLKIIQKKKEKEKAMIDMALEKQRLKAEAELEAKLMSSDNEDSHETGGSKLPVPNAGRRQVLSPIPGGPSSPPAVSNPQVDLQERINQLLTQHGVSASLTDENLNAYQLWLKRHGLKPSASNYKKMIDEFCQKVQAI